MPARHGTGGVERHEDALHVAINADLDELEARNHLTTEN
jgi:hypothetical protein